MCSTPLGITEVGTRARSATVRHCHGRAQRLSASLRLGTAAPSGRFACMPAVCSTPLGITELVTTRRHSALTCATGCSTPLGITEVGTRSRYALARASGCAQRLSASLRLALERVNRPRPVVLRAQRLSASLRLVHVDQVSRSRSLAVSAQRLSASLTWSRRRRGIERTPC